MQEIALIVTRLELDRQITLTEDQKSALCEKLYDLNESPEHIQIRADFVLKAETYGTLAYPYWVSDQIRFPKVKPKAVMYWCEDCKKEVEETHVCPHLHQEEKR